MIRGCDSRAFALTIPEWPGRNVELVTLSGGASTGLLTMIWGCHMVWGVTWSGVSRGLGVLQGVLATSGGTARTGGMHRAAYACV
jgi:hypothetical protein